MYQYSAALTSETDFLTCFLNLPTSELAIQISMTEIEKNDNRYLDLISDRTLLGNATKTLA